MTSVQPRARIVIVGGGGHARVVADTLTASGRRAEIAGFVDTDPAADIPGIARLGDDRAIGADPRTLAVLGIGAVGIPHPRIEVQRRLEGAVGGWTTAIHPRATLAADVSFGPGTVVMAGAIIQPGARIGSHCIVNTGVIVEHDVIIGDHAVLSPGCVIGGGTVIGSASFIGLGARLRDHITIGACALVAMGSVVVADVAPGASVRGVPARSVPAALTRAP